MGRAAFTARPFFAKIGGMDKWFGESEGMPPPHVEVLVLTELSSVPQVAYWRESGDGVEWRTGRVTDNGTTLPGRVRRWTHLQGD